jgi:hydroxymethylpyrimidine pyrophosphatase-like HAD family hydrolase
VVPKLIAVDFDGTIADFKFPAIGDPKPGAREALEAFRAMGYRIMIYTCRTSRYYPEIFATSDDYNENVMGRTTVVAMKNWLDEHQIPYDDIDDGSLGKPLANVYIDDKGLRFSDNWEEIQTWVTQYQP